MSVQNVIKKRRSFRSLELVEITDELIEDLAQHISLTPSCKNNQPWKFIFVKDSAVLKNLHTTLPKGNTWAQKGSMIVAVYSSLDDDCIIDDREYYLFDTGMAVAFLILRATELGLVAHPIAGYDPDKVKKILDIDSKVKLIALIVIGKHADKMSDVLSEDQIVNEMKRPERKNISEIVRII